MVEFTNNIGTKVWLRINRILAILPDEHQLVTGCNGLTYTVCEADWVEVLNTLNKCGYRLIR